MNLTLHVTDLDSWVWYHRIESMEKEELIGRLLRTEPPNEQMLMGTAFHAILENPPSTIDTIEKDGFKFVVECDAELAMPQVREIRANKLYYIDGVNDGVNVRLTGGTDGITGNKIIDHKLTFKPNPENYFSAYQWRAYLDIYDADVFEYRLYHGYKKPDHVLIKDISTMTMYRYPGMKKDLEVGLGELVSFIKYNVPSMIK